MIVKVNMKIDGDYEFIVPGGLNEEQAKKLAESWASGAMMVEFNKDWLDPTEVEKACEIIGVTEEQYFSVEQDHDFLEEELETHATEVRPNEHAD